MSTIDGDREFLSAAKFTSVFILMSKSNNFTLLLFKTGFIRLESKM